MTKITDVGKFTSHEKSLACREQEVASILFFDKPQGDEAIENNTGCSWMSPGFASDFVCRSSTGVDQSKKIVLEGCVQDLAIGEVPQNSHQRTRGQFFRCFSRLSRHALYSPSLLMY